MKTRKVYITIALVLAVAICWMAYDGSWDGSGEGTASWGGEQAEQAGSDDVTDSEKKADARYSSEDKALLKDFTPEQVADFTKRHNAALAANQKVLFYGKVVDQYGDPVVGLSAPYRLTVMKKSRLAILIDGKFKDHLNYEILTDETGRFTISHEEGMGINFDNFTKEGYGRGLARNGASFSFGQLLYGTNVSGLHQPDPFNPVVFEMWKNGGAAELIKGRLRKTFPNDGTLLGLDLTALKVVDDLSKADIIISGETNFPEDYKLQPYEWSFRVEVPGGGLKLVDDAFLYFAHESGYVSEYHYEMKTTNPKWDMKINRLKFYIRSGSGVYSSIRLSYYDTYGNPGIGSCELDVLTNPSGSRNLEYDPSKNVTKNYRNK